MNQSKYRPQLLVIILLLLVSACNIPGNATATNPPPSNTAPTHQPTITATAEAAIPVEHRIGVRVVDGIGEFYDRATNEKFIPRGNNYIRLDPQPTEDGGTQTYHSVFDPGLYDQPEILTAFENMHALGYNTVRVFISQNTIGTSSALNEAYMDNIIDFLKMAKDNDLYVIFTQDWLPGGKYGQVLGQDCCEKFNMNNIHFLSSAGLEANTLYFQDFVRYLIEHNAPLDAVFAYELRNEMFFDMDFAPFSLTSGLITALNGKSYDMSNSDDKKRMIDENMVIWMDSLRAAILELDPTALVSVGFFWPQEPNPARIGDPRYVNTASAIWESQLDFIDLHPYPASELTLEQYVENFGMEGMEEKPIIMGEFGASTHEVPSVDKAVRTLMNWQVDSCQYGFDGWLLWTWDIYENNEFYSAISDQGQIGEALAPINRPDPCQSAQFDFLETNIALNAKVTASRSLANEPSSNAVDGTGANWGAGAFPKQWIEIDLGQSYTIKTIRLMVAQYPEGNTVHQIQVRNLNGNFELVHTFDEFTVDNQILIYTPDIPLLDVQFIRITTISSLSWVAWKEIEIIIP